MILGLGNDLVRIERFGKAAAGFAKRVLTPAELAQFEHRGKPLSFLAKRWAAKEAAAKALGTGIADGVTFQDFEISNNGAGKPSLALSGRALELAKAMGVTHCHLALSDERDYAMATVILES
ncbi:holo-ACP synthase [Gallaecimonas kandeliae]|uniref:holo-ACP synthase n=1 Tax=Gallaecimonas kandeliae TaxID=3029055 RepID=UPI002648022F|nr:holo-ACP synthase [Gallaecimonas kandeliae]WKE66428.1 holo-ACP synthase [Gallaecimonas kandeliae]